MTIDSVTDLKSPYSDKQLGYELFEALGRCFSLPAGDDMTAPGALEKHLGARSYSQACRARKMLALEWDAREGYRITPTNKIKGKGYVHLSDLKISLDLAATGEELAQAVRRAIEIAKGHDA